MKNGAKKSFYIFLCSLMGMLVFILLQRSLFLLAFLAGINVLSFNFQRFDYITFVLATVLGLWYGIWLGLHWYYIVYEEMSVGSMFSGFGKFFGIKRQENSMPGASWNLDDLVSLAETNAGEVIKTETIAVSESPVVHARTLHHGIAGLSKPKKTPVKKTIRRVSKKVI